MEKSENHVSHFSHFTIMDYFVLAYQTKSQYSRPQFAVVMW